jgi:quinoprotein glucose dehydrogenase
MRRFHAMLAVRVQRPATNWADYGGTPDNARHVPLRQITRANLSQLGVAWSYPTRDTISYVFNPIVVDNVAYVLARNNSLVAVDASTGKELWVHENLRGIAPRGINYWQNADGSDRRLIFQMNSYLQAIDAKTGTSIMTFGTNGVVDLREGLRRDPKTLVKVQSSNPGKIFENLLILGSAAGEHYLAPPGDIRAYDVVSGRLAWQFHTVPHPGEFGYDTWPAGAYKWAGGANAWGEISIDETRGIAYFPLGSATHDSYGGDRKGANLFANSLLALDARTGKRLWHFQTIHHDIWDYDLTTAPKLLTIQRNGKNIDVVAQATKFGLLYVFDRVTGQPIWPIEERPVPQSDVPGEATWPTQPYPTHLPPFARLKFGLDDINPHLEEAERARLREILRNARNEGLFTPQTLDRDQISIPGELGGSNWAGSAADPTTGMLYVRTADQPAIHRLRVPGIGGGSPPQRGRAVFQQYCEVCHGQATAKGIRSPDGASLINLTAFGADRLRQTVRSGKSAMPPFSEATISSEQLEVLATYLADPAAAESQNAGPARPPLPHLEDITRYTGPLGSMFRSSNGLPAISPPWAELVAYDLNEGTIKWRSPLGIVRALAAKGITNTGNAQRVHRNGPVVTAGGLIFIGTNGDGYFRAFDKDSGATLFERALDANPEGMVAVYEVAGRQYVAFCASYYPEVAEDNIAIFPGKREAQGYYVFALPKKATPTP